MSLLAIYCHLPECSADRATPPTPVPPDSQSFTCRSGSALHPHWSALRCFTSKSDTIPSFSSTTEHIILAANKEIKSPFLYWVLGCNERWVNWARRRWFRWAFFFSFFPQFLRAPQCRAQALTQHGPMDFHSCLGDGRRGEPPASTCTQ